jgi:AcrR family transcriptional regulator
MSIKGRRLMRRPARIESISKAAARVFAQKGYAETSMDDVSAAAGITKLIVYRHFNSKQELYEHLLERERERLRSATGGPGGFGTQSLSGLLAAAREDPDSFLLLFRHAAREPQFAAYSAQFSDLATAVAQEHVDPAADPTKRRWLARLLARLPIEAVIAWLEVGEPTRDAEMTQWLARLIACLTAPAATAVAQDASGAAIEALQRRTHAERGAETDH